jgi:hypothetical protein
LPGSQTLVPAMGCSMFSTTEGPDATALSRGRLPASATLNRVYEPGEHPNVIKNDLAELESSSPQCCGACSQTESCTIQKN